MAVTSKKRARRNVQALNEKRVRRRVLARSMKAKRLVQTNRGLLLKSYRLIVNNLRNLKKGRPVKAEGISIKKAATGTFKGRKNLLTLLVKSRRWEFFVKVFKSRADVDVIKASTSWKSN